MTEREQLREALGRCVPEKVVTWPTPYDRRWGLLDDVDRIMIVNSVLAVLDQQGWPDSYAKGYAAASTAVVDLARERDAALREAARYVKVADKGGSIVASYWPLYRQVTEGEEG